MKKTLLETYALAVCFGSMICISITSGIILYDVVEIIYPEVTADSYMLDGSFPPPFPVVMQSSGSVTAEAVKVNPEHSKSVSPYVLPPPLPPGAVWGEQLFSQQTTASGMSAEDLEKEKQQRIERVLKHEQNNAKRSLIRMLIILFVSSIVFLIHWRMAKRINGD